MELKKTFILLIAVCLIGGGLILPPPAYGEEGVDYGYWCTDCGRHHGPGESCPLQSAPSRTKDEPYDFSQPSSTPTTTLTPAEMSEKKAQELNAKGEEFFNNGRYQEAHITFWWARVEDGFKNQLYKENQDKAYAAWERQLAEKKKQAEEEKLKQAELEKRSKATSQKIKNIQPSGTSVVDFRDKKEPLVFTPNVVKGKPAKPYSLKIKEPPAPGTLSNKEMWDLIADMQLSGRKAGQVVTRKRIFENNPDKYLTNPLWTKEKIAGDTMRAMDNDSEYVTARKKHVQEADTAIYEAQIKLLEMASTDLNDLRLRSGSKDFTEFNIKCESDPVLKKKSDAILDDYRDELQIVIMKCSERLQVQMAEENKKFFRRHPELKKVN